MSTGFPNFSRSAKVGRQGVSIVNRIVSDTFGWLFKQNHQEDDFGIDGQLEVVTSAGAVTGQLLAVQIKCGASFLGEKTKWGYVYRGETKHFNYLANYPIPVLICLCDPATNECWWAHFKPELTEPTPAGWKMTIPFESRLAESQAAIEALVAPVHDALSQLQDYWKLNRQLVESSVILYMLDEHDVESQDVVIPRAFFDRLRATKEMAQACQGKVEIMFSGYDDDPRELYEIDEVRAYVALLDPVLGDLLFFARTEKPTFTLLIFALCQTTGIEWPHGRNDRAFQRVSFDPRQFGDFINRHWLGLNELADWIGLPEDELKRISYECLDCVRLVPPGGFEWYPPSQHRQPTPAHLKPKTKPKPKPKPKPKRKQKVKSNARKRH